MISWCCLQTGRHRATAPLRHIVHSLTLVDLVNEFRCVVHNPHRGLARDTGPGQTVHLCDSQTVDRRMQLF